MSGTHQCGADCPGAGAVQDGFVDEALAGIKEYVAREEPLAEDRFEDLRARFARGPGEPATLPDHGRSAHVRQVDPAEVGAFVAETGVALVEADDEVHWADLHGVAVDDEQRLVPVVVAVGGDAGEVAERLHAQYHALQQVSEHLADEQRVVTDGGAQQATAVLDDIRELAATEGWDLSEVSPARVAGELRRRGREHTPTEVEAALGSLVDGAEPGDASPSTADHRDDEPAADSMPEDAPVAEHSGEQFYPASLRDREWWVDWVLAKPFEDGEIDWDATPTKQPVAPYRNGSVSPVKWHFGLSDEDHPATDFETVDRYEGLRIGLDVPRPEHVLSDEVGSGIIIPTDQANDPDAPTVTLIDWDDVRDPETGEIHPVTAWALEEYDGFAEVSQSAEGVHQFVTGEIPGGLSKFIRHIDDEPFVGDDLPQVEMYQSGRLCAMTGQHVEGTGDDLVDGQDLIDELCWRFGTATNNSTRTPTDPFAGERDDYEQREPDSGDRLGGTVPDHDTVGDAIREAVEYDGEDPREWEYPDDWSLGYAAALRARERSDELPSTANWELIGYVAGLGYRDGRSKEEVIEHLEQHPTPQYGFDPSRAEKEVRAVYRKADADNYEPPSLWTLIQRGILPESILDDPEHGSAPRSEESVTTVQECEPPVEQRVEFNADDHHEHLEGDRYDRFIDLQDDDEPTVYVWNDPPGTGKTTSASRTASIRERAHSILFETHRKALQHREDGLIPDDYRHLRGTEQKRQDCCMKADTGLIDECPEHGEEEQCPSACPVYDLGREHPVRQRYEALVRELNPTLAHLIMGEDLPGHDEDGSCFWMEQFGAVENWERVVGVHEYATLKTIQRCGGDPRDVIFDESPRALISERELTVLELTRMGNRLIGSRKEPSTARAALGFFALRLADVITGDPAAPDSIDEVEPPRVKQGVDIHALPDWADEEDVESVQVDRALTDDGDGRVRHIASRALTAEELAQAKLDYGEEVIARIKDGDWDGAPLAVDALLAVAVDAGVDAEVARRAAAGPTTLRGRCPRCGGELDERDGRRLCHGHGEDDSGCGWDEGTDGLLQDDDEQRIQAWLHDDGDHLVYRTLPQGRELPSNPLVLDATATQSKIRSVFEVDEEQVVVDGDETFEADMEVLQVLDGQFHSSTIQQTESLQRRKEKSLQKLAAVHEKLLVVGKSDIVYDLLDLPDGAFPIHYGGLRGLNYTEFDAVVCVGAPHPNMDDLQRDAELLAQGQDLRVGGEEHSTRHDCPNDPVWRKLNYQDDDGRGRAVATKHYTGLTGDLFREAREDEFEQAAHRIRPLLADETQHVYLLSNVPTRLPIDEVCTLDELAEPLQALLPVDDRAVELAQRVHDLATDGEAPDGFRPETLVEETDGEVEMKISELHRLAGVHGLDVSERTVRRWVDDLEAVGLLVPGEYEQQAGRPYTAELDTLTAALEVLSCNESVEVALKRRIAALAANTSSAGHWLAYARPAMGLAGDRLDRPEVAGEGPPPG